MTRWNENYKGISTVKCSAYSAQKSVIDSIKLTLGDTQAEFNRGRRRNEYIFTMWHMP